MTSPDQEPDLLRAYEALLACSAQMLDAARDADWEALIERESEYLAQVEGLQQLDDAQTRLDEQALERKARLLEQLLEQDKEIRQRLLDRREELSRLILGSRQQKALSKTYCYYQGASEVVEAARRFVPS
jgi:flagellar protein FliT